MIKVNHVSKKFAKDLNHLIKYGLTDISKTVFGLNTYSHKLRPHEFWAINNVSFKLKKGEALGIIGPNGSGKTTLLKMINGILEPDKGSIKIKGRVGALIEVGAGFHPLLTGKENIWVNGSILGMSKIELNKKYQQIVDFADIGDFINAPVRTYSSGMFVRLGFAIAVHANPDILLVDEVLAVGDFAFRVKCYQRIQSLKLKGASIILVSHNMGYIQQYCDRALLLSKSRVVKIGRSDNICQQYLQLIQTKIQKANHQSEIFGAVFHNSDIIKNVNFQLVNQKGRSIKQLQPFDPAYFYFSFQLTKKINDLGITLRFYRQEGLTVSVIDSRSQNIKLNNIKGWLKGEVKLSKLNFSPGRYLVAILITDGFQPLYRNPQLSFTIPGKKQSSGFINLQSNWNIKLEKP